jgi:hypothetical protein
MIYTCANKKIKIPFFGKIVFYITDFFGIDLVRCSFILVLCLSIAEPHCTFFRYPGFGGLEEQYSLIIQSGLARILDLVKTAPDTSKLDQISLLEAIKVPPGIYCYNH